MRALTDAKPALTPAEALALVDAATGRHRLAVDEVTKIRDQIENVEGRVAAVTAEGDPDDLIEELHRDRRALRERFEDAQAVSTARGAAVTAAIASRKRAVAWAHAAEWDSRREEVEASARTLAACLTDALEAVSAFEVHLVTMEEGKRLVTSACRAGVPGEDCPPYRLPESTAAFHRSHIESVASNLREAVRLLGA
jgi:hypothetical protein